MAKRANESQAKAQTERKQLPRGVRFYTARQRPNRPFALRWKHEGKTKTQFFPTEQERQIAADALDDKRQQFGADVLSFDPKEWRQWQMAKSLLGDTDILIALSEWKSLKGTAAQVTQISVREAAKKYLEFRSAEQLSPDTVRHIEKHVGQRFVDYAGGRNVRDISADFIIKWLASLRSSKGARKDLPVDPLTRRHHRKDVNTFFDYCVKHQWIDRNPCELVPVPATEEEDVELLTLEEGRRLFAENRNEPIVARLALEAFGFLRASSAGRIKKDAINLEEKGIRLLGPEHKSRKTKYRQGHPDNLWKWLALATDETWNMEWWQYRNEKTKAFARAKISGGSENRLRKTCLSAHIAWLKNQPLTSYLAQHRHTSTTDIYLGVMSESDGKAWFEITP